MTHATETQCAALLGILAERRDRATRNGMLGSPRHDWIGPALAALEERGHATSTPVGDKLRWYTATDAGVAAARSEEVPA